VYGRIVLNHILVPIDFSENSKKALRYAIPLAEKFGASVTLINIIEPTVFPSDFGFGQMSFPDVEQELVTKSKTELDEIVSGLSTTAPVATVVKTGIPFVEVTSYADEEKVDLIIVATHGRTGVEHILFGSTAEKIIRKAPCPALVVRAEERDFIDERV
jgi:nucleotide-binding universal stress UspA family protein